jgi:signal transduction histidine kinase
LNLAACEILELDLQRALGVQLSELADGHLVANAPEEHELLWSSVQLRGRTLEVRSRLLENEGQTYRLTNLQDATQRIATERSLRARISFEDLVISVATTFITLEPDQVDDAIDSTLKRIGRATGVDRAYVYRLGAEDLTLTNLWAHEDDPRPWKNPVVSVASFEDKLQRLAGNEPVVYETIEQLSDGASRPRSSVCVPMLRGNTLKGFVGFDALWPAESWRPEIVQLLKLVGFVFASTIARREAQLREAEAYATLEQKVEERTRELRQKQAQLAHAEKMASLGQLVAGVAHEVNTPLGAIKSNNDVLSRVAERLLSTSEVDPAKLLATARQVLGVNHEAIRRIERIVGSLRQFARLDQAEVGIVNIHNNIDTTLTLLSHEFKHRIEVTRFYGELPEVECYPNRLNQVFMNLFVNATQAIVDKGRIEIRTKRDAEACVISISDDGEGIAAENVAKIFDPGFTTKGVGVGTGLGLSIVQRIVQDHGGTLDVSSELGKGTTFTLRLPLRLVRPSVPVLDR